MSRVKAVVKAPSKLNLYLDVLGRRGDGYHDICTVMQTVSIYNTVCITVSTPGITLSSNMPGLPADAGNTAYKAALAFSRLANLEPEWCIELNKEVPYQAGMGSASADAAGTLAGLNAMYDYPLRDEQLFEAGAEVGADVPFMLAGGTALCEGVGDRITRLNNIEGLCFVVAKGSEGFLTSEIYRRFDLHTPPDIFLEDGILKAIESGRPARVAKYLINRFEYCLHDTTIAEYKALLLRLGALGASMTGSGSAVFGAFDSSSKASLAADRFGEEAVSIFGEKPYVAVANPVTDGPSVKLVDA